MRWFLVAACLAFAVPAAADSKPLAKPTAQPEPPAKATCKPKIVGKGLERKVICEIEATLVVSGHAPRPQVLVVQTGGKKVTGRPTVTDPFKGLRQLDR